VGKVYTVQPCRTCKGMPEGKILIRAKIIELNHPNPAWGWIMEDDAKAEGGYTPEEYEKLYNKMHPGWEKRYAYLFQYYTTEEIELMETDFDKAFAMAHSRISQQLRNSDPSVSAEADELETAKSEIATYPPKAEVEKGEKEK